MPNVSANGAASSPCRHRPPTLPPRNTTSRAVGGQRPPPPRDVPRRVKLHVDSQAMLKGRTQGRSQRRAGLGRRAVPHLGACFISRQTSKPRSRLVPIRRTVRQQRHDCLQHVCHQGQRRPSQRRIAPQTIPDRAGEPPQASQRRPAAQPVHCRFHGCMPGIGRLRKRQFAMTAGQHRRVVPAHDLRGAVSAGGFDPMQPTINGHRFRDPKPLGSATGDGVDYQAAGRIRGSRIGKQPPLPACLADCTSSTQLPLDALRFAAVLAAADRAAEFDRPGQKSHRQRHV